MEKIQIAYLVLSQVAAKALTFGSNQVLLRSITPAIFGTAAYLEFIVNSVLFFSREAERVACQRASGKSPTETAAIVANFGFLPVLVSVPVSAIFYVLLLRPSAVFQSIWGDLPSGQWSLLIVFLSVELELLAEPLFALNQLRLNFKLRSKVEASAVMARCAATFAGVMLAKRMTPASSLFGSLSFDGAAVLAFALGYLVHALVIFGGYFWSARAYPRPKIARNHFDPSVLAVWKSLFVQMIFKHLLTEGDTLLVGYLFSVAEQGVYSVISNYGSLVARLLFQPIEESLRVSFTRLFADGKLDFKNSYKTMAQILSFYVHFLSLVVLGGYTNGGFLMRLVLGRSAKWSDSSVFEHFPRYVLYIPFMAFNGILEAFFSSACTQAQISRFSAFMSVSSIVVFALSYYLIEIRQLGISGLILSNVANMSLRIAYCSIFFLKFYRGEVRISLKNAISSVAVPFTLVGGAVVANQTLFESGQTTTFKEFCISVSICLACLLAMVCSERKQLIALVKQKSLKKEQ